MKTEIVNSNPNFEETQFIKPSVGDCQNISPSPVQPLPSKSNCQIDKPTNDDIDKEAKGDYVCTNKQTYCSSNADSYSNYSQDFNRSQYDNCCDSSIHSSLKNSDNDVSLRDFDVDKNTEPLLLCESSQISVQQSNCDSSPLVCSNKRKMDGSSKHEDVITSIVVSDDAVENEMAWQRVVDDYREKRAHEAVATLGQQISNKKSSPFVYKSWLLRLSHRRRFEIVIALGLFVWIAFFVILAIFMNGPPSELEDTKESAGNDRVQPSVAAEEQHTSITSLNRSISIDRFWNKSTEHLLVYSTRLQLSDFATTSTTIETTTTTIASSSQIPNHKLEQVSSLPESYLNGPSLELLQSSQSHKKASGFTGSFTTASSLQKLSSTQKEGRSSFFTNSPTQLTYRNYSGSSTVVEDVRGLFDDLFQTNQKTVDIDQLLQGKNPNYMIGVGRADITGPAADVNMMGYANPSQTSGGVHLRQYSRAFVIGQGKSRVAFVNIDACMSSTLLKLEVLRVLRRYYDDLYNADNLCISGIHTHSAPAGFLQDVLFQITSMGFVEETLDALVNGIVESIHIAHRSFAPGYILINKGELLGANINRSPTAYLNNPESERIRYKHDVDKDMILLKFLDKEKRGIGMINWFAVHCTSMNNTNSLISSDNKGYAELLFEQAMDPGSQTGQNSFVAAFAQSNEGDVSPNTKGPHCVDTGLPCDNIHSTCNGKVQNCIASGPGKDMFESTEIIAKKQYEKALELYKGSSLLLTGPIQAVHQYVDMTNQTVVINSTHSARTCLPAMGFSFAAGTTDGPGAFDFKQGDKTGNGFWKIVRNFVHSPSKKQKDCHYPKPILLDTGEMHSPYSWQPSVVDTQLLRIGQLVISAVPGEFTTMSGRRLREAILKEFSQAFPSNRFESVVAGLSNTYSDYITTFEEYHVQRYEGASTIFGPHTLNAYIQQYKKLAASLTQGVRLQNGTEAKNLRSKLISFLPGVIMDNHPFGYSFGNVLKEANDGYKAGDVVSVQFVSGNPRNSPSINMTFLTVERKTEEESWTVIKTDADWETKFIWERSSSLGNIRGLSEVTVEWDTSSVLSSGYYRLNHFGHYKYFWNGQIYSYSGRSKEFYINATESTR